MTVKELRKELNKYAENLTVVTPEGGVRGLKLKSGFDQNEKPKSEVLILC